MEAAATRAMDELSVGERVIKGAERCGAYSME